LGGRGADIRPSAPSPDLRALGADPALRRLRRAGARGPRAGPRSLCRGRPLPRHALSQAAAALTRPFGPSAVAGDQLALEQLEAKPACQRDGAAQAKLPQLPERAVADRLPPLTLDEGEVRHREHEEVEGRTSKHDRRPARAENDEDEGPPRN